MEGFDHVSTPFQFKNKLFQLQYWTDLDMSDMTREPEAPEEHKD